jgi:uncharacterized beta-barrel protein YwiB (DUF1934 family)
MKEDVKLRIVSQIDDDRVEFFTEGKRRSTDNGFAFSYEEADDFGISDSTTEVTVSGDERIVMRRMSGALATGGAMAGRNPQYDDEAETVRFGETDAPVAPVFGTPNPAEQTVLVFEKGKKFKGEYVTPYGFLPLEMLTRNISNKKHPDGRVEIVIDYDISVQGVSENHNVMRIEIE